MSGTQPRQQGLTLLECLVALAIIAVTLAAVSRALIHTAQSHSQVQVSTKALWVAQNRHAELRAQAAWPTLGVSRGEAVQGGLVFHWVQRVERTPNPLFRRVEIAVSLPSSPDQVEAELTEFVARPLQ